MESEEKIETKQQEKKNTLEKKINDENLNSSLDIDDTNLDEFLKDNSVPDANLLPSYSRPFTLQCKQTEYSTTSSNSSNSNSSSNDGINSHNSQLHGTISIDEGNMTHFVAEDVETKIKLSSPVSKLTTKCPVSSSSNTTTPNNSTLYRQLLDPQITNNPIDTTSLLNDLENDAQRIATSVDNLIENLSGILHSISSITADNVDVYKNAVSKISDSIDGNIKSMYTLMSKVEEASQEMKKVECQAAEIKEMKKLVDLFETFV